MKRKPIYLCLLCLLTMNVTLVAQDVPRETVYKDPVTGVWINTYGNIRLTNRLFWVAQTHFRFQEDKDTKFVGQLAQVYNRHAISYLFSKKFNVSLGGVLRVNYNSVKDVQNEKNNVPEWRIWHQYLFASPFYTGMVYHRLRLEHRWSKGFVENSDYIFRNRWRYMFKLKMPLFKPKLESKTFYVSPEVELIMQSGEPVVDSPMEDLRLHASFGYILNPRLTFATGLMHSQGQDLSEGAIYKQKWTLRFHVYFSLDMRKVKYKLPAIHMTD